MSDSVATPASPAARLRQWFSPMGWVMAIALGVHGLHAGFILAGLPVYGYWRRQQSGGSVSAEL